MLSPKVLALIDYQFRFATTIKCIPFGWNNKRSIIKLVPLRRHTPGYYLFWLNIIIDYSVTSGSCIGYIHFIGKHRTNMAEVIPMAMYVGIILLVSLLSILTNICQVQFMTLMNKLLQTNNYVSSELELLKEQRFDRPLEWFWKGGVVLGIATPYLLYSFLTRPDGNENLYTHFGGTEMIGRHGFAIITAVVALNKWIMIQTVIVVVFALMLTLRVWLKIMLIRYENGELKPDQTINMHNCIQIFSAMNHSMFTWLIFPLALITASIGSVSALSTLILYRNQLSNQVIAVLIEVNVIFLIGILVGFDLIREATSNSNHLLTSLHLTCCASPYFKRRVKACIPYSVKFGSLFKAKAVTVLTVYGFIVQNTISLVILNKN